ncbi:MAG: GNAT family N-acetyltransferase [Ignavibacteriae bacterium]|nr:GNAT family N-acetyltransferase [Ignavibacteriota bacterium]
MKDHGHTYPAAERLNTSAYSRAHLDDSSLTIQVVRDAETFSTLRNEWNELAVASSATIYQTHEWLSIWWKYYGSQPNRSLYILLFRYFGKLVGVTPLCLQNDNVFGLCLDRRLTFLGSGEAFGKSFGIFFDDGPSDYLDIIILPGFEIEVCHCLLTYLKEFGNFYDTIELVNAKPYGTLMKELVPRLEQYGFSHKVSQAEVCSQLHVPPSFEKYLFGLKPSVRRRLSQALRAAEDNGIFTIKEIDSLKGYKQALHLLIQLHQKRWNRMGYPGLFADQRFQRFQEDIINAFYQNGWLWCKTAHANGSGVAARLSFKFNNCYYDYLSGFDDASLSAKYRPGLLLLIEMIKDAIREKIQTIDLLRGDEQYKTELAPHKSSNWNIIIRHRNSKGKLHLQLFRSIHSVMRFLVFLMNRERKLIVAQYDERSFPKFVISYIKFRCSRLINKIRKARFRLLRGGDST